MAMLSAYRSRAETDTIRRRLQPEPIATRLGSPLWAAEQALDQPRPRPPFPLALLLLALLHSNRQA
jgi:hypothetical protein